MMQYLEFEAYSLQHMLGMEIHQGIQAGVAQQGSLM